MKKDVLFSSTMAIATPRRSSQLQLMPYNRTITNCNSRNQEADELFPAEELVPISHSLIPTALANLFNLNLPPSAASPPPSKPVNNIQIASSPTTAAAAAIAESPLPHNHTVDRAEPDMAARVLEHTAPTASCCNSGTPDLDPSDEICPKPQAACTSASPYHDESAASMKAEYHDMVLANKQAQTGSQQQQQQHHHHTHHTHSHSHPHHHQHRSRRNAEMQQEMGNGSGECEEMGMMGGGHGGCKRQQQQQHDGMDEYGLDEMGADMELSSMMMGHMGEKESSSNSGDGDGMDGGGGGTGGVSTGGGGGGGGGAARTLKRPRLVWTPQLHKRFVDAVSHLGIRNAVPKTIMQLMNVGGLTRENVASHLQKYRLYLRRMQQGSLLFSSSPTSAALLTSSSSSSSSPSTTSCSKPIIMNHHQLAISSSTTTASTTNHQFPASPTSDALFSGAAHGHGQGGDPTSTARAQLLVPHHRAHSHSAAPGPVIHPNPAPNHAIKINDHLGMHPPMNALILHAHPLNNHHHHHHNNNPQQLNPAAILNNPSVLTNPNDQASFLFNPVTSCNQSMQPPPPPPPNRGVSANPSPTSNWMTPSPNLTPSATPQIQLDPYNNRHNHHHHHEPHRPLAFNLEPASKQLIASPPSPPRVALALFPQ